MPPDSYYGEPLTPRYIKERKAELECIEMFSGRPNRHTIISEDEIINLRITLETSNDVNEFLQNL